jgi:hypothetical protein
MPKKCFFWGWGGGFEGSDIVEFLTVGRRKCFLFKNEALMGFLYLLGSTILPQGMN